MFREDSTPGRDFGPIYLNRLLAAQHDNDQMPKPNLSLSRGFLAISWSRKSAISSARYVGFVPEDPTYPPVKNHKNRAWVCLNLKPERYLEISWMAALVVPFPLLDSNCSPVFIAENSHEK
jgi:hypothetical protein